MADMWGKLTFHSETGTEGGYWAFEDDAHTHGLGDLVDGRCPWDAKDCPVTKGTWHEHARYEGLSILRDGDELWIYDKDSRKVQWSGIIKLKRYPLFTESAQGMWIHADQEGVDRERWASWFFEERRARLRRPEPGEPHREAVKPAPRRERRHR